MRTRAACNQQGKFCRDCPNRLRSHRKDPHTGKQADGRQVHFSDNSTVGSATLVLPSVRSGALSIEPDGNSSIVRIRDIEKSRLGYRESAWRIPIKVNGYLLSAVVDIAAEITIVHVVSTFVLM